MLKGVCYHHPYLSWERTEAKQEWVFHTLVSQAQFARGRIKALSLISAGDKLILTLAPSDLFQNGLK